MEFPSPAQIKEKLPLNPQAKEFIQRSRITAQKILSEEDPRLLIIAGPCSLHQTKCGIEYAERFKELSKKVEHSCFLIMRGYVEKSRTLNHWKGLIHDPDLNDSYELEKGIVLARELLLHFAKEEIAIATEFVSPLIAPYIEDLVTWGFIGARTCASQPHRQLASMVSMPIGFKNSLEGNIDCAINGVIFARHPHTFLHVNNQGRLCKIKSSGNPFAHVVHRGGFSGPNFDAAKINQTLEKLKLLQLPPRIIVDCAHGNSQKNHKKQKEVFYQILEQIADGNRQIFGLMLESYLEEGSQKLSSDLSTLKHGVSITDPCMDWNSTEEMIHSVENYLFSSIAP